jgi:hypothetical protein
MQLRIRGAGAATSVSTVESAEPPSDLLPLSCLVILKPIKHILPLYPTVARQLGSYLLDLSCIWCFHAISVHLFQQHQLLRCWTPSCWVRLCLCHLSLSLSLSLSLWRCVFVVSVLVGWCCVVFALESCGDGGMGIYGCMKDTISSAIQSPAICIE